MTHSRLDSIDVLRGGALLAMVVYHAAWDLSMFGLTEVDVANDPLWTLLARATTCAFLALVGVSLVLARQDPRPGRVLRRFAITAAAAGAVSLGSWYFQPEAFIYFGILHCIALSGLLGLVFLRAPGWVVAAAAAFCLAAPWLLANPFFDRPWWLWLGLSTEVPVSADHVPILPWFGVVLLGVLAGREVLRRAREPFWQARGVATRLLAGAGRWTLLIYLLHQPLLLGGLTLLVPTPLPGSPAEKFEASCRAAGQPEPICRAYAACIVEGLAPDPGIAAAAEQGRMTPAQATLWRESVARCRAAAP